MHGFKIVQEADWVLQIVNPKGEMKGSAITGPVAKEAAELWPVCLSGVRLHYITTLANNVHSVSRPTPVW